MANTTNIPEQLAAMRTMTAGQLREQYRERRGIAFGQPPVAVPPLRLAAPGAGRGRPVGAGTGQGTRTCPRRGHPRASALAGEAGSVAVAGHYAVGEAAREMHRRRSPADPGHAAHADV